MSNKKYVDELIVKAESYDIVDVGARSLIDKVDIEINAIKGKISSNATSENKLVSVKDISSTIFSNYGILTKLDTNNDGDLTYNGKVVCKVTSIKGDNEETYRTGNVNITKDNIGLGNVENYKAVSVNANQSLTNTEKANARANIGAGTSSFSGSYNDLTDKPSSFTPSAHNHDDRYYTESEIDTKLAGKSGTEHNHDDRYFTETEVTNKLAEKANKITYITLTNFNALSKKDANTLYVITG